MCGCEDRERVGGCVGVRIGRGCEGVRYREMVDEWERERVWERDRVGDIKKGLTLPNSNHYSSLIAPITR